MQKAVVRYECLNPEAITRRDVEDINLLRGQLTDASTPMDRLEVILVAKRSIWIVARNWINNIVAMATLTISHIPTGIVGHVDDVVVREDQRRQGIAEAIMRHLVEQGRGEFGVGRIELTCRPDRDGNGLYKKVGFQLRETNCYILKF